MQDSHNPETKHDIRLDLRIRREETPDLWEWVQSRRSIAAGVIKAFLQDIVKKEGRLYGIPIAGHEDSNEDLSVSIANKLQRFDHDD